MRAAYSRARPRRAAGPTAPSRASPVFTDQRYRRVLNGASPMTTGASLAPMPCSRQRCHSGVFCLSRSILGMDGLPLSAIGELAVQHLERRLVGGCGHLRERGDLVVRQHPLQIGAGIADQFFEFMHLVGADRAIGTWRRKTRVDAF